MSNRRQFLQNTLAAAGVLTTGLPLGAQEPAPPRAARALRILVLGGTGFIGPHIVETAIARGHNVTLFNRGRTNPHLFPDLDKRQGDRDPLVGDGLSAIETGEWDAVVDTSGFVPRIVGASASLLADRVGRYLFISSISVYDDPSQTDLDETSALAALDDATTETITGQSYGPLKAACERAVDQAMGGRSVSLRPGYIVGPRDPYHRLTYWAARVARGGEILAPGSPADPVQYIDARDLAALVLHRLETEGSGATNVVGPRGPFSMAQLLYGCQAAFDTDAVFSWIEPSVLEEAGVSLPIWVPPSGEYAGFGRMSNDLARRQGLTFRPLASTAADALAWLREQSPEVQNRAAAILPAEVEARVLGSQHQATNSKRGA